MSHKHKSAVQPSSPARRHFMAIAVATARRLSVLSVTTSMLSGIDIRPAAADRNRGHGHQQGHGSWHGHERAHGHGHGHGQGYAGVRCFGQGTLVLTNDGEVPIDALTVGVPVITLNGAFPIKWIGRKTLKRNGSETWHPAAVPVRVSRFAIDDHTPRRDLYLSEEHALFIDGALIPVKHLVNGRSIVFDNSSHLSETLVYYHVELDTHQVMFAEGAPTETFLYTGGTIAWDNFGEYQELYGDHAIMSPFAPRHSYAGVVSELNGLVRLAASRIVDVRDPIQIAHDRLAARALAMVA
jgi:hypothetical protein